MKILINGLIPYDAGKTTFSLNLLRELKTLGYGFRPLKPIAGHNIWYSFSTLLRSKELKVLAGNDALKYYDETKLPIEEINPFAALLSPPDLEKVQMNIRLYNELLSSGLPIIVRYYDCREIVHFYASSSLSIIPDSLVRPLKEFIKEVNAINVEPSNLRELLDSSPKIADLCVSKFFSSNLIVESYNDAVAPTYLSTAVDLVFTVSPGKVFLIEDFKKVIQLFDSPPWNIKVSSLIKYFKLKSWTLNPSINIIEKNLVDYISNKIEEEEKYKS